MDSDCEMNRQFAKRLRRQQMSSPKSIVLKETVNTPPVVTSGDEKMNCDPIINSDKPVQEILVSL